MQFPNAQEGVQKIYKAEILMLIGAVAALLGVIFGAIGGGALILTAIFVIAAAVLAIIAFIMNISGVNRAAKDEQAFKSALYALLIGIVASAVVGGFSSNGVVSGLANTVSTICEFLVSYYVCTGIINLAAILKDDAVGEKGKKTRSLLMIVWICSAVLKALSAILSAGFGTVLGIFAGILSIVAYIMYLGLLKNAAVMLKE